MDEILLLLQMATCIHPLGLRKERLYVVFILMLDSQLTVRIASLGQWRLFILQMLTQLASLPLNLSPLTASLPPPPTPSVPTYTHDTHVVLSFKITCIFLTPTSNFQLPISRQTVLIVLSWFQGVGEQPKSYTCMCLSRE